MKVNNIETKVVTIGECEYCVEVKELDHGLFGTFCKDCEEHILNKETDEE